MRAFKWMKTTLAKKWLTFWGATIKIAAMYGEAVDAGGPLARASRRARTAGAVADRRWQPKQRLDPSVRENDGLKRSKRLHSTDFG